MTITEVESVAFIDLDRADICWDLLSPDEQTRALRFHRDIDRHRYAAGRAALRRILGDRVGAEPRSLPIAYGPHGRPYLHDGPSFNVSHAGRWCVVATDDTRRVGIDIEDTTREVEIGAVAGRVCSSYELDSFSGLAPDEQRGRFFELWTAKEAVLKALGTGFSVEPATFSIATYPQLRAVTTPDRSDPADWELRSVTGPEGTIVTMAIRSGIGDDESFEGPSPTPR